MEVPEETLEQLRTIKAALDELEEHMQPFLEASAKDMSTQLTPIEHVKTNLALAQAVAVLFQLHSRLNASKLDNHPVQKDLERLAMYEKKVIKAITANDLARSKPGTSLNIAAANRFIDAAIPDLSAEQKEQLRELGKRATAEAAASKEGASSSRLQPQQQQQVCQGKPEQPAAGVIAGEKGQRADSDSEDSNPAASSAPVAVLIHPHNTEAGAGVDKNKRRRKRSAASAGGDAEQFLQEVMAEMD